MGQQEFSACGGQRFDFHAVPQRIAIEQNTQHNHLVGIVQRGDFEHFQPVTKCLKHFRFLGAQVGLGGDEFKPRAVPGADRRWQIPVMVEFRHRRPAFQVITHTTVSLDGNGAAGGYQFPEDIFCLHFKMHDASLGKFRISAVEHLVESCPVAWLAPKRKQMDQPIREHAVIADEVDHVEVRLGFCGAQSAAELLQKDDL